MTSLSSIPNNRNKTNLKAPFTKLVIVSTLDPSISTEDPPLTTAQVKPSCIKFYPIHPLSFLSPLSNNSWFFYYVCCNYMTSHASYFSYKTPMEPNHVITLMMDIICLLVTQVLFLQITYLLVILTEFQSFPTTSFLLVNFVKKIIIIFIHFKLIFYFLCILGTYDLLQSP